MVRAPRCKVSIRGRSALLLAVPRKWALNAIERSKNRQWRDPNRCESTHALAFGEALWLGWGMLLKPALESDAAAIVDLVNIAVSGKGERQSWNIEDFIERSRIDAPSMRDDIDKDVFTCSFIARRPAGRRSVPPASNRLAAGCGILA